MSAAADHEQENGHDSGSTTDSVSVSLGGDSEDDIGGSLGNSVRGADSIDGDGGGATRVSDGGASGVGTAGNSGVRSVGFGKEKETTYGHDHRPKRTKKVAKRRMVAADSERKEYTSNSSGGSDNEDSDTRRHETAAADGGEDRPESSDAAASRLAAFGKSAYGTNRSGVPRRAKKLPSAKRLPTVVMPKVATVAVVSNNHNRHTSNSAASAAAATVEAEARERAHQAESSPDAASKSASSASSQRPTIAASRPRRSRTGSNWNQHPDYVTFSPSATSSVASSAANSEESSVFSGDNPGYRNRRQQRGSKRRRGAGSDSSFFDDEDDDNDDDSDYNMAMNEDSDESEGSPSGNDGKGESTRSDVGKDNNNSSNNKKDGSSNNRSGRLQGNSGSTDVGGRTQAGNSKGGPVKGMAGGRGYQHPSGYKGNAAPSAGQAAPGKAVKVMPSPSPSPMHRHQQQQQQQQHLMAHGGVPVYHQGQYWMAPPPPPPTGATGQVLNQYGYPRDGAFAHRMVPGAAAGNAAAYHPAAGGGQAGRPGQNHPSMTPSTPSATAGRPSSDRGIVPKTSKSNKGQASTLGNSTKKRGRGRPRKNKDEDRLVLNNSQRSTRDSPNKSPEGHNSSADSEKQVKNTRDKIVDVGYVVSTGLEETISKAASLVAAEVRSGSWVVGWADEISNAEVVSQSQSKGVGERDLVSSKLELQATALNTAGAALTRFAFEQILPSFVAAGVGESPANEHQDMRYQIDNCRRRSLVATFLVLRDCLMMNADAFFFDCGRDDAVRSDIHRRSSSSPATDDDEEERALRSKILSTALINAAVHRLDEDERKDVMAELERAIGEYDFAEDSFSSNLERADGRSLGVLPNGRELGEEENVAWRVSFNFARDRHPLIQTKKKRDLARRLAVYAESREISSGERKGKMELATQALDGLYHRVEIPMPTAAGIYFVEKQGDDELAL